MWLDFVVSHPEQEHFFSVLIENFAPQFAGRVVDIGALDINGGPHRLFSAEEYVGVDLDLGPNVNVASRGELVDLPSGYFDVSMSSECFEHNPNWRGTLHNMIRMTVSSGIVAFSCATTGRPEHGTSRSDGGDAAPLAVESGQEHYANVTAREVWRALDKAAFDAAFMLKNDRSWDLYFVGVRHSATPETLERFSRVEQQLRGEILARTSYSSNWEWVRRRAVRLAVAILRDKGVAKARAFRS